MARVRVLRAAPAGGGRDALLRFVYTRWESEEAFRAWADSAAFTRGHAQAARDRGGTVAQGSALLGFEVVQHVERGRR
jgi:heme oxygenase (mycobilin-producing)